MVPYTFARCKKLKGSLRSLKLTKPRDVSIARFLYTVLLLVLMG